MINYYSDIKVINSNKKEVKISIDDLNQGVNSLDNYFIKKNNQKIEWVVDRMCDHNFGKLIISKTDKKIAKCPMHDWKLNLDSLKYTNVNVSKKKINFKIENGNLIIDNYNKYLDFTNNENNPEESSNDFKFRYLSHASVLLETNNFKMITDPWYFGSAFCNGWWLRNPPKFDLKEVLSNLDFIYISHNHPDHLHIETLKKIDTNTKIICANFKSKSTEKLLKRLGFKNVITCEFNKVYQVEQKNIFFTLLKSGDFRDDSGIYIRINKRSILLNVDSNNLNFGILPKNIDLLLSSYAGGAGGFPLCFDDYTDDEKIRIKKRNQSAQLAMVMRLIEISNPKYFMPYAGYFAEYAKRDDYIFKNNKKNDISLLDKLLKTKNNKTKIINYEKYDTLEFKDHIKEPLLKKSNISEDIYKHNDDLISIYINDAKSRAKKANLENIISEYFTNSKFEDNLELLLIPVDDNFQSEKKGYLINFENKNIEIKSYTKKEYLEYFDMFNFEKKKILMIRAREDALYSVLSNKLPFEDLLIGFQCRIKRKPNIYNSNFWNHFTNVYIDGDYIRYYNPCNSCEIALQQIF